MNKNKNQDTTFEDAFFMLFWGTLVVLFLICLF